MRWALLAALLLSLAALGRAFVPFRPKSRARALVMSAAATGNGGVQLLSGAFGGSSADARRDIEECRLDYQMTWSDGPGARYSPHTHEHTEVIYVVSGEMTFTEVRAGGGGSQGAGGGGMSLM